MADAYWALRAARPYRAAVTAGEALRLLRAGAGQQFDTRVVDAIPAALRALAASVPEVDAAG